MSFTNDVIVSFDPGGTTGYYKGEVTLEPDRLIGYIDHGEMHQDNPNFISDILWLVRDAKAIIIERAVMHGQLNRDKVNQLTVTEKINTIVDVCNLHLTDEESYAARKVYWIHPESKRLSKEVPEHIKGSHARDAYKLLDAFLEMSRSGHF